MNSKLLIFTSLIVFSIIDFTACNTTKKIKIKKEDKTPLISSIDLNDTFVYDNSSKYKNILKDCVAYDNRCSLNTLPLLRDEGEVTKDKIKERLVVSHKWMGDRFLEMLDLLPPDIKEMFGAVTAIVIDNDIRPSFYTIQNGAIYIDPRYLWLTPDEAKTITQKDDFRSSFGKQLKFIPAWRYVKGNQNAIAYSSIKNPQTRTKEDIKLSLARLLYHELSHANDFANKDVVKNIDRDLPILDALESNKENRVSTRLYRQYPLSEPTLIHLGKVLFFGMKATNEDYKLSAQDVGLLFDTDYASNMYNYANQYEDMAMLFETAMMKYHYNIDMDIGFVNNAQNARSCDDYTVGWGVRNRIANSEVSKRVNFVLKHILPNNSNEWDKFTSNNIGKVSYLKTNSGWCSSIDINSSKNLRKTNINTKIPFNDFLPPYL